jgi:hypothetical protein
MTNTLIKDIVKQLVLANNDDEIEAIAVVFLGPSGEPEIQYAVSNTFVYGINFGLDCIKAGLLSDVLNHASKPGRDRE